MAYAAEPRCSRVVEASSRCRDFRRRITYSLTPPGIDATAGSAWRGGAGDTQTDGDCGLDLVRRRPSGTGLDVADRVCSTTQGCVLHAACRLGLGRRRETFCPKWGNCPVRLRPSHALLATTASSQTARTPSTEATARCGQRRVFSSNCVIGARRCPLSSSLSCNGRRHAASYRAPCDHAAELGGNDLPYVYRLPNRRVDAAEISG